jgi:predicted nuclease with TOPRIM domain
MTEATLKLLDGDLKKRRQEVNRLRDDLENLEDHLDLLEARQKALGKPKLTQAQAERRYAVK